MPSLEQPVDPSSVLNLENSLSLDLPVRQLPADSNRFRASSVLNSMSFAFEGLVYAAKTQRNFRIHLCMALVAISMATVLHLAILEWALLWGAIGIVLFAELVNTSIELLVDLVTNGRYDLRAKAVKDVAAGAVLVTAMAATICGVCIFAPHLMALVSHAL